MNPGKGHWLRAAFISSRFLSELAKFVLDLGEGNSCLMSQGESGCVVMKLVGTGSMAIPEACHFHPPDSLKNYHNITKNKK